MVESACCDVLVVGGGPSGIAAAVGAARAGARVLLLEKYGFLGGLAVAGMVGTVCGLYYRGKREQARHAAGGFAGEWAQRLARASPARTVQVGYGLHVLPYEPWAFARAADEIARETKGLEPVLHGVLTGLTSSGRLVTGARMLVWNREVLTRLRALVDCTGEATAVHMAGGETQEAGASQAAGVVFCMEGVESSLSEMERRAAALREITRAARNGRLPVDCASVSFLPGIGTVGRSYLKVALSPTDASPQNRTTALEFRARDVVEDLARFLVDAVPGFRGARLGAGAFQVGIRIGRRVCGEATLSETDVLGCKKPADGVACGTWPIEVWGTGPRPRLELLPEGEHYEIPIGCLIARGFENLFVGGRSISATPLALASARVIGTSLATGWAAGTAAAMRTNGRPLAESIALIREQQAPGRGDGSQVAPPGG